MPLLCSSQYKMKLKEWYDKKVTDDSGGGANDLVSNKIGFDEWLRVLDRQDIVGEWEVEQMSEITGDESTKGNIKCRLSIPTVKIMFVDSQEKLRDLDALYVEGLSQLHQAPTPPPTPPPPPRRRSPPPRRRSPPVVVH